VHRIEEDAARVSATLTPFGSGHDARKKPIARARDERDGGK